MRQGIAPSHPLPSRLTQTCSASADLMGELPPACSSWRSSSSCPLPSLGVAAVSAASGGRGHCRSGSLSPSARVDRRSRACTRTSCTCCPCRGTSRSEEHTSELQSLAYLVCRLLL